MNIFDIDKKIFKKERKHMGVRLPAGQGFSLGELLVVIMIIVLLALAILFAYRRQIDKANDATRKEHLKKFRIAFEDYYNDHNCYPSKALWDACTCGGACLAPYMEAFLCDPNTGQKYYYYLFNEDNPCQGYRLFSKLNSSADPDIVNVGCSWTRGCGDDTRSAYNYGIAMGGPLTDETFNPNPTSTPTPTVTSVCNSITGPWACDHTGSCHIQPPEFFTPDRCFCGFKTNSCDGASPSCQDRSTWCKY